MALRALLSRPYLRAILPPLSSATSYPDDQFDNSTKKFCKALLERNPENRLGKSGASEIMEAKWFTSHIDWLKIKHDVTPPPFQAGRSCHADSQFDIGGSCVLVLTKTIQPSSDNGTWRASLPQVTLSPSKVSPLQRKTTRPTTLGTTSRPLCVNLRRARVAPMEMTTPLTAHVQAFQCEAVDFLKQETAERREKERQEKKRQEKKQKRGGSGCAIL